MLDKTSSYVQEYLRKISSLKDDILNQDYSYLEEKGVKIVKESDKDWKYWVVKDLDSKVYLKSFYSDSLKSLILDENIMDVTIQSLPPKHYIEPHIDNQAHKKNVWRVLLPISCNNFILKRSGKSDVLQVGESYEIDYTYEVHSSWNTSDTEPFITWMFDIFYPDDSLYDNKIIHGLGITPRTKMEDIDLYFGIYAV
mgnify:FL=1